MMYHAALPQQKQLRRQLFIVAVDLADHIASIRGRGRSGRFRDLIVAIVGPLFLIDQRPLNVDSFDLLLEDIGIGADLGQLFPLEITQKAESCNAVIIAAVAIFLEADLDQTAIGGTLAIDKSPVQELLERPDAGGRQGDQQRHIFTTAQQIEMPHKSKSGGWHSGAADRLVQALQAPAP